MLASREQFPGGPSDVNDLAFKVTGLCHNSKAGGVSNEAIS